MAQWHAFETDLFPELNNLQTANHIPRRKVMRCVSPTCKDWKFHESCPKFQKKDAKTAEDHQSLGRIRKFCGQKIQNLSCIFCHRIHGPFLDDLPGTETYQKWWSSTTIFQKPEAKPIWMCLVLSRSWRKIWEIRDVPGAQKIYHLNITGTSHKKWRYVAVSRNGETTEKNRWLVP